MFSVGAAFVAHQVGLQAIADATYLVTTTVLSTTYSATCGLISLAQSAVATASADGSITCAHKDCCDACYSNSLFCRQHKCYRCAEKNDHRGFCDAHWIDFLAQGLP